VRFNSFGTGAASASGAATRRRSNVRSITSSPR
jgi:hypothetical protein